MPKRVNLLVLRELLIVHVLGVVHLSVGITVLVPPSAVACPGDSVTLNCSVTSSTCGVLSWSIDSVAVGTFLDVTGQLGTKALNPDISGVLASITDINSEANNISSTLAISSAGYDVANYSQVSCTDGIEQTGWNLIIANIVLNSSVRPTLRRSATITVQFTDPAVAECIIEYVVQTEPTNSSAPTPAVVSMASNIIEVSELNFCSSNYTFRITAYNRNNNISFADTVLNVAGNLDAINIHIEPSQNSSVVRWQLMKADHPENCNIKYELTFDGKRLPGLVSDTHVSQMRLTDAGFPFCITTTISVAPHISAHGVIENKTVTTSYIAKPTDFFGPTNVQSTPRFVFINKMNSQNLPATTVFQMEVIWNMVPRGTFGPSVNPSTDLDATFKCSLTIDDQLRVGPQRCNSSTGHTFPVEDAKPFGKRFYVIVDVDYIECTNLFTNLPSSITATITSFPKFIVRDTSVDIIVDVNTKLVTNDTLAEVYLEHPESRLVTTDRVVGSKYQTIVDSLSPKTTYKYNITFKNGKNGINIDEPIFGAFTTRKRETGLNIVELTVIIAAIIIIIIVISIIIIIVCYWKKKCNTRTSEIPVTKMKSQNGEMMKRNKV